MIRPFATLLGSILAILSLGISAIETLAEQRVNLTLQASNISDYSRLLEQAMGEANDAIAATFESSDSQSVSLTILADRNGQVLPLLMADISRQDWQQQPDVERWSRYSTSARTLLGYEAPATAARPRQPVRSRPIIADSDIIDALD